MITFPNTVLIGTKAAAGSKGYIDIYDESARTVLTASNALTLGKFVVGVDTGRTYNYIAPDGSKATVATRKYSRPIIIAKAKELTAENYAAPALEVTTITADASWTPISGEEYVLRIIYKDIVGHPGQFTQSYRYNVGPSDTAATILAGLAKQINNSKNARVSAVATTTTLVLTALEIDNNEGLVSINEFTYVNFVATFYEANSLGVQAVTGVSIVVTTPPTQGVGYWKTVRDREKWSLGYEGVTNPVDFFGPKADLYTEVGKQYDQVVIKSSQPYMSPDNNYIKETDVVTELYLENDSTASGTIVTFTGKLKDIFGAKFLSLQAGSLVATDAPTAVAS
jgi:hypothetical protein